MKNIEKDKSIIVYLFLITISILLLRNNMPVVGLPLEQSKIIEPINLSTISTVKELENTIEDQIQSAINTLETRWTDLSAMTDTYEKYLENADQISAFYETIVNETNEILITLREDSVIYAEFIMESDLSAQKKYKAIDDISDLIYDDLCDDVLDDIYDGLLDDMNDFYYEGILDDASDYVNYSDWYDVSSNEYSQWYYTASDVYKLWYNASSDIYSFCYDLSGKLYNGEIEGAKKTIARYKERIEKIRNKDTGSSSNADFNTEIIKASTTDELEDIIYAQVESCVQAIYNEWNELSTEIDTFEKYTNNVEQVENFYDQVISQTSQILILLREYSVVYAEMICSSGIPYRKMYDEFKNIQDVIYDDGCSVIKSDIYEDLLMDMRDYYYDGIIRDAKDSIKYSDWSDARGDAYKMWSDARGDVYSNWSDARSDIYKFISDTRGEVYSGDMESAQKKIERFTNKIEKMK